MSALVKNLQVNLILKLKDHSFNQLEILDNLNNPLNWEFLIKLIKKLIFQLQNNGKFYNIIYKYLSK